MIDIGIDVGLLSLYCVFILVPRVSQAIWSFFLSPSFHQYKSWWHCGQADRGDIFFPKFKSHLWINTSCFVFLKFADAKMKNILLMHRTLWSQPLQIFLINTETDFQCVRWITGECKKCWQAPIIRILPSQNVSGSHTPWCVTFQGHTHTNTTAALLFLFFSSSKHQSYFFFLLGFSLRSVNKKQQVSNMTPPMHRFSSCGIDLCFIQGCAEVSEELLVLVFIELSTEEALRHDLIRMC